MTEGRIGDFLVRLGRTTFVVALMALCATQTLQAEGRALLIGVGRYQAPGADLPGVGKDLAMMRRAAGWLGFAPRRIRIVEDEAATLSAVEDALGNWLREGVEPNDPVLIYFSGHGSRIWDEDGDESRDGADEVLMLHDARPILRDGRRTLDGVLVDDRFAELLRAIPSRRVLVLVDACHSGTVVKGLPFPALADRPLAKFYRYPGMPAGGGGLELRDPEANFLALSAAGDDEEALPSENGSYFTRGLYRALQTAMQR